MFDKLIHRRARTLAALMMLMVSHAQGSEDGFWPINAHYYRVVLVPDIRWVSAKVAAEAAGGYLATCTSSEENQFVFSLVTSPQAWETSGTLRRGPWLGGFQQDGTLAPTDGWTWIDGEPWSFTTWAAGQPDDEGTNNEKALHYAYIDTQSAAPTWGNAVGRGDTDNQAYLKSFVVEFDTKPVISRGSRSTFEFGGEGWATYGDAKPIEWQAPAPSRRACVYLTDLQNGRSGSFLAPVQFLGKKAGTLGGAISFDLKTTEGTNLHPKWDIRLHGAGRGLFFDLPDPTVGTWTPRLAPLTVEAGWRVNSPEGDLATKEDLLAVLSDLDALLINGEFHHGSDKTMLADVVLSIREDFDRDGDVDGDDLQLFSACGSGPMVAHDQSEICKNADLDDDGDVDQEDFGRFQRCWSGDQPADPTCAN